MKDRKSLWSPALAMACGLALVWGLFGCRARPLPGQPTPPGAAFDLPEITLPEGVPAKVKRVLRYIDEHGKAPPGFVGGRVFYNEGRAGVRPLPRVDVDGNPIEYHEWDVNRREPGHNRGKERLVTGSDGSAYYTGDHYQSFDVVDPSK